MKKSLIFLLLVVPFFIFGQRGQRQQNTNEFHNRDFWETQPNVAIVKQKIKEGHDPVAKDQRSFDAVSYAILGKAPIETVEFLLSFEGNDINKTTNHDRTYLLWAGSTGDLEIMKMLINKGADTKVLDSHSMNWYTYTLNFGHENTGIYDFIEDNGFDLKQPNRAGANAILLLASHSKDGEIFKYFIEKGLDVNATDNKGNNFLFYAAKRGNIDLIKKYVNEGFDYKTLNSDGENLMLAASHGGRRGSNPIAVFQYFDTLGIDMTATSNNGANALHNIVSSTEDVNIINFFIQKGIDINQKDKDGNTPFLNAAKGNNLVVLEKLLPLTKNINQQNNDGLSAITYATQRIGIETFNFLKDNGADVHVIDKDGNNLFYYLFNAHNRRNSENFETFQKALTTAGVSFKNASKIEPPLHIAIVKGDMKLIETALDLGADINKTNSDGLTPLHLVAMKSTDTKLLQFLISKGANKKSLTAFEESVLDLAQENELLNGSDISFLK